MTAYPLIWHWRVQPWPGRTVDRKGQACRVVASGALNSVLVEFADGFRVLTSRYAVRDPSTARDREASRVTLTQISLFEPPAEGKWGATRRIERRTLRRQP